jgi:hypothetical protein
MTFNSALWRQASGITTEASAAAESNTPNYIPFDETSLSDNNNFVFSSEFTIRSSIPESERVFAFNNDVQSMGLDGVDMIITGLMTKSKSNPNFNKLLTWLSEDQKYTGFNKGRFSIRMDNFPDMNVNATATRGLFIGNVRFIVQQDIPNKIGFVMPLRIGGDLTRHATLGWAE